MRTGHTAVDADPGAGVETGTDIGTDIGAGIGADVSVDGGRTAP
jgi:hypothetical protein